MSKKTRELINPETGEVREVTYTQMAEDRVYNRHHDLDNPRYRRRAEYLNDAGQEIPDPRPIQPPIGYSRQPSIFEIQREQIALHHKLYAEDREYETFEESEDFDVDDDYDPSSPWENDHDPSFSDIRKAVEELNQKVAAKVGSTAPTSPDPSLRAGNPPEGGGSGPPLAQDKP